MTRSVQPLASTLTSVRSMVSVGLLGLWADLPPLTFEHGCLVPVVLGGPWACGVDVVPPQAARRSGRARRGMTFMRAM
jgi:hypothetical protein